MQEWPLRSHVELRALPASVRSARLHARNILHEWRMGGLADTAELLVSEMITNAVRASALSRISSARPGRHRVRSECDSGSPRTGTAS